MGRWCTALRIGALVWLLGAGVYFVALRPAAAQSAEVLAERLQHTETSVRALTNLRIDARLSVLEDAIVEMRWVWRSVAGVLIMQLIAHVFERIDRRREARK